MKPAVLAVLLFFGGSVACADAAATLALNDLRAGQGRKAVTYSPVLEQVAEGHARDMVRGQFFSHTGSNGSTVGQRIKAAGYQWCFAAENIAQGQRSLGEVLSGWQKSRGHRRNLLHRKVREFGLARGQSNTWVMVLAAPC